MAVDGEWTCNEFGSLLQDLTDVYDRINSIFVIRAAIDTERREIESARKEEIDKSTSFNWLVEVFGQIYDFPFGIGSVVPPSYDRIINLTRTVALPLQVDAISYASPGWIQLIGYLNVLKVISDFISKWRAENTKREVNRMKYDNEQLKIKADLAAKLLEIAPKIEHGYQGSTSRMIDIAESVVNPTNNLLETIGKDKRIGPIAIVKPGEQLPIHEKK